LKKYCKIYKFFIQYEIAKNWWTIWLWPTHGGSHQNNINYIYIKRHVFFFYRQFSMLQKYILSVVHIKYVHVYYQFQHSMITHLPSMFTNGFHPKTALWKIPNHISSPSPSGTTWPLGGVKNERPTCTNLTNIKLCYSHSLKKE
jgi:hypothetical protein